MVFVKDIRWKLLPYMDTGLAKINIIHSHLGAFFFMFIVIFLDIFDKYLVPGQ